MFSEQGEYKSSIRRKNLRSIKSTKNGCFLYHRKEFFMKVSEQKWSSNQKLSQSNILKNIDPVSNKKKKILFP